MVVDQNGYVVRGNKAAEKMLGYPQEEIIGKHMKELTITDESTVKAKDKLMVSLQEKGFIGNFEHVWLKKDGSLLPVEQNITYLVSERKADFFGWPRSSGSIVVQLNSPFDSKLTKI